jgi:hypothetical protein
MCCRRVWASGRLLSEADQPPALAAAGVTVGCAAASREARFRPTPCTSASGRPAPARGTSGCKAQAAPPLELARRGLFLVELGEVGPIWGFAGVRVGGAPCPQCQGAVSGSDLIVPRCNDCTARTTSSAAPRTHGSHLLSLSSGAEKGGGHGRGRSGHGRPPPGRRRCRRARWPSGARGASPPSSRFVPLRGVAGTWSPLQSDVGAERGAR